MAYVSTPAGTIVRETNISTRRIPVYTATTITKGEVCEVNATGYLITSPTSQIADREHFVALETIVNSGASGVLDAPVAVSGHYVTVTADGDIRPGERVKVSGSTAGQVVSVQHGTDDIDLVVGVYFGKEGGTVSKSGSTPYLESFTDNADFPAVAAADGNVIEILVK